jgi:hypothetical protein
MLEIDSDLHTINTDCPNSTAFPSSFQGETKTKGRIFAGSLNSADRRPMAGFGVQRHQRSSLFPAFSAQYPDQLSPRTID